MSYHIELSNQAEEHLAKLKRNEPVSFKKALLLLDELSKHPEYGTGKPERLRGNRSRQWSRRITAKHRLVYEIRDEEVLVYVVSSYGHYD